MKTGIFGGTFNPPHTGHLIVAEYVREKISLDKVVFVPSAVPPHKQDLDIVEAHHRLEMLQCAVQGNRYFEVSDIEVRRGGVSFTVDTLVEFKGRSPDDHLYFLIGMDNLRDFDTWKMGEKIVDLAEVVAMTRPGFKQENFKTRHESKIVLCDVPEIAISSRDIRERVKTGKSIRYLVPGSVETYITRNHLYR